MIPILNGYRAGLDKIAANRALGDRPIPASLQARLRDLFGSDLTPEQAVAQIISDVRARGDAALREWTRRLDGVELRDLQATREQIETAYAETPSPVREALHRAADRIRLFHAHQAPRSWTAPADDGSVLGQRMTPIPRVGIYVPAGTAPLPSSLLMSAIPAQVAGVREIIVATPPGREGTAAPVILAAAQVAGVTHVLNLGGAQAIAALATGTASVPRVDKIFGAGGLFTAIAKRQVFGLVGIDGLAGPTETLLIADDSARASWVAADLLAQAEHDVLATSLLITPAPALAERVAREIEKQVAALPRRAIIEASLRDQGAIVIVDDLDQALALANAYAPEHLCLLVREPEKWADRVQNAGGIFVGEWSSEALGDYVAGPSHVMPTGGTARYASPLNVNDFIKITSLFQMSPRAAQDLAGAGATLAEAEGLQAHANALRRRLESK